MHSALSFDAARQLRRPYLLMPGAILLFCALLLRAWVPSQIAGLPTAAHVAAISLLTASLLPLSRAAAWSACAIWAGAAVVLECLEHPAVLAWLMRNAPMWTVMAVHELVSLRQTGMTRGFQVWEIVAALVGAGAAFFYLRRISQ